MPRRPHAPRPRTAARLVMFELESRDTPSAVGLITGPLSDLILMPTNHQPAIVRVTPLAQITVDVGATTPGQTSGGTPATASLLGLVVQLNLGALTPTAPVSQSPSPSPAAAGGAAPPSTSPAVSAATPGTNVTSTAASTRATEPAATGSGTTTVIPADTTAARTAGQQATGVAVADDADDEGGQTAAASQPGRRAAEAVAVEPVAVTAFREAATVPPAGAVAVEAAAADAAPPADATETPAVPATPSILARTSTYALASVGLLSDFLPIEVADVRDVVGRTVEPLRDVAPDGSAFDWLAIAATAALAFEVRRRQLHAELPDVDVAAFAGPV